MYTKGDWKSRLNVGATLGGDKPKYLVGTGSVWVALTSSEDDARLIAAAPAMLEALKELMQAVDNGQERIGAGRGIKIAAIIARAENHE